MPAGDIPCRPKQPTPIGGTKCIILIHPPQLPYGFSINPQSTPVSLGWGPMYRGKPPGSPRGAVLQNPLINDWKTKFLTLLITGII